MRWTRSPICGKRQDGKFILVRQINTKRMREKLREIKETLHRMCHQPVLEQGRWLGQVLRCYFAYHAVPTTSRRMTAFAFHVVRHWWRALLRRSQKVFVPWQRSSCSSHVGFHPPGSDTRGRNSAFSSNTRGGSRVR